jgi:5-hydroxyisourate hydrolase
MSGSARSPITTHVLDLGAGRPREGIRTLLRKKEGDGWREIGGGVTDKDGRVEELLPKGSTASPGTYSLTFEGVASPFFPEITITFVVTDPAQHYHVPLLLSPYGYSTYRGS